MGEELAPVRIGNGAELLLVHETTLAPMSFVLMQDNNRGRPGCTTPTALDHYATLAAMTWFLDKEFLEKLDLGAYDAAAIAKRLDLPVNVVARFVDPARRYVVQTNEDYGWAAGKAYGFPALVFFGKPRLSGGDQARINMVVFPPDGSLRFHDLDCLEEELEIGDELLNLLADDLSFEHTGSAEVRAFKHEELWHYALVPFPWHLHAIAVGEKDDEDDRMSVRSWIENGNFVLQCGNNYFMRADGGVASS